MATSFTLAKGGRGGRPFDDAWVQSSHPPAAISSITVQFDTYVHNVSVEYGPSTLVSHGRGCYNSATLRLAPGEHVTRVDGRAGGLVDRLTLHTSAGRVFGPCGGPGGRPFSFCFGANRLAFLSGRAGHSVDALCFAYVPLRPDGAVTRRADGVCDAGGAGTAVSAVGMAAGCSGQAAGARRLTGSVGAIPEPESSRAAEIPGAGAKMGSVGALPEPDTKLDANDEAGSAGVVSEPDTSAGVVEPGAGDEAGSVGAAPDPDTPAQVEIPGAGGKTGSVGAVPEPDTSPEAAKRGAGNEAGSVGVVSEPDTSAGVVEPGAGDEAGSVGAAPDPDTPADFEKPGAGGKTGSVGTAPEPGTSDEVEKAGDPPNKGTATKSPSSASAKIAQEVTEKMKNFGTLGKLHPAGSARYRNLPYVVQSK